VNKTGIEYLDLSWNPIAMRCTPCGEGCQQCWHLRMANRLSGNLAIRCDLRAAYAGEEPPVLVEQRLWDPLRRKKPARIGVQFMGDLFHDDVPFEFVHQVFETMERAQWHTFIILTKRPERMQQFIDIYSRWRSWPLPNVWGLVSAENQQRADERMPILLRTPFAVRGVSLEPLLGPVILPDDFLALGKRAWVIAGGETGPGARPAHPDWFRGVRDACAAADVPFFFKQWGEWWPHGLGRGSFLDSLNLERTCWLDIRGSVNPTYSAMLWEPEKCYRVGKKAASRLLDGQKWEQWPKREVADD